ncbi:MAG: AMP-binding enzyme, partial [Woeseiaceae bacterium]
YRIAGVREAAVVPVPDEVSGGITLVGCIAATHPSGENYPDAVMSELAGSVPAYMMPVRMLIFGELPKTSTGKIDRQCLLRELPGVTSGRTDERRFEHDQKLHCQASAARQ